MIRASAPHASTPHQRDYIRDLMRQIELPLDRVTVMHRDLFRAAGIPWRDYVDLDAELATLTRGQASRLIDGLKKRTDGDDEAEEDD